MNVYSLVLAFAGIILVASGSFGLSVAWKLPMDSPGQKMIFAVSGVTLLLIGMAMFGGIAAPEKFVSLMNIQEAYPDWADSQDNGQIMQKNEQDQTMIRPMAKITRLAAFSDAPVDPAAPPSDANAVDATMNTPKSIAYGSNPYKGVPQPQAQPAPAVAV